MLRRGQLPVDSLAVAASGTVIGFAVALLDGQLLPEQYLPERIVAEDVQQLLCRVKCAPIPSSRGAFPNSTALACAFVYTTGALSSASNTTTRAFTPGL